jgi:hypothetical protein
MPRVVVEPLDATEIAQVHAAVSRHGVAVPPPATLIEHTRGMPAHLDHLLRYVLDGGGLDGGAPMSIGDVVAARLSMLAQPTLDLLQAAAVFGEEVDLDVLRMTNLSPGRNAEQMLKDAVGNGLVHDDTHAVRFASRLIRNVVYDATPADVRRALHAVAADALGAVTADPAPLGHHHDLAGHASRAVGLLGVAGDRASQQLDDVGAGQMYQRALRAVRDAMLSGEDDNAQTNFVHLSVKLAEALRARGEVGLARGVVAEARSWASAPALEASLERAQGMILAAEDDGEGAATHLRRGIGKAIASGDMTLVCDLYIDLANTLARSSRADSARQELVECLDLVTLGEGLGATTGPENLWMVLKRKAQIVSTLGELDRALRLAEAALHHAVRVKSRLGKARIQSLLADLCDRLGQTSRAERYRKAAVEEMRRLGDRRATAELLLTDTSQGRSVRVIAPGDSPTPAVSFPRLRDPGTGTDGKA